MMAMVAQVLLAGVLAGQGKPLAILLQDLQETLVVPLQLLVRAVEVLVLRVGPGTVQTAGMVAQGYPHPLRVRLLNGPVAVPDMTTITVPRLVAVALLMRQEQQIRAVAVRATLMGTAPTTAVPV